MSFLEELTSLINKHSKESESDTPDFLLAQYIEDCLAAYAKVVRARDVWWQSECAEVEKDARIASQGHAKPQDSEEPTT